MRRLRPCLTLACFALPAALFLAVCAVMGFAPFGSRSILIFDLSDQFVEFLCALKQGDVFFSWNTALGGSYIGTFSYYVSSPFSLLTLLCPNEHMPIAVVFLVALKLGLAGLTFSLLLRRRTGRYDPTTLAFSLCYALMAYNMAYAMSFMWLDGVLWLPVLLMGAEDLLDSRRPWLLVGALAVSFVSSWYISYMTGLFCALYLLWRCVCEGKPPLRSLLRLAGRAALSLLLTAWLWLPTALSMLSGKLAEPAGGFAFGFNWPLTTLLYKLLVPGAYDSVTYTGSAFLYCSLPAAVLAVLWFFRPGVARRSKLATLSLCGFLLVSLWFAPLDRVWHLFQAPNSFPGRWSFVVSCFLLLLAYDALLWLLSLVKYVPLSRMLPVLLVPVLAADMTLNALLVFRGLDEELGFESYASYRDYKTAVQPLVNELRADGRFIRVASDVQRSRNEPAAFAYMGLSLFSSSYNAGVNRLLNDLGYAQDWFWSTALGSTPVSDALLGIGWRISNQDHLPGLKSAAQSGALTLLHNPAALSVGYCSAQPELTVDRASDPLTLQNLLMSALSGVDQACFLPLQAQCTEQSGQTLWRFTSNAQPVYAWFPGHREHATLSVNGGDPLDLYTNETDCVQYLGTFPAGQSVELLISCADGPVEPLLYTLDMQTLDQALSVLEQNRLQVTGWGDRRLEGTVTAPADNLLLYTSIPDIPGWSVMLDGSEVTHSTFCDLILIPLGTAGEHTLSLRYTPPGLTAGLALTGLGVLLAAALLLKQKKR